MINPGLYKVEFRTQRGHASGVVVLGGGKFQGGDSNFYYQGTYEENDHSFHASAHVKRHTAGGIAIVAENALIEVRGTASSDQATLAGTSPQAPQLKFEAHIKRLAD